MKVVSEKCNNKSGSLFSPSAMRKYKNSFRYTTCSRNNNVVNLTLITKILKPTLRSSNVLRVKERNWPITNSNLRNRQSDHVIQACHMVQSILHVATCLKSIKELVSIIGCLYNSYQSTVMKQCISIRKNLCQLGTYI